MIILPPEKIFHSPFVACLIYKKQSCKEDIIIYPMQSKKCISLIFNMSGNATYKKKDIHTQEFCLSNLTFIAGRKNLNQLILNYSPEQNVQLIEIQFFQDAFFHTENSDQSLYPTFGIIQNELAESRVYSISTPVQVALQQLLDFYEPSDLESLFYTGKILEIWASVYEQLSSKVSGTRFAANIERAKEILESDYANPPTIEELAELVSMSLPHFKRIFKQISGTTAYKFLQQKRMEFALTLLTDYSKNISEIADMTGYKSKSHFSKIFLKHYGVSPSFFRKNTCNEIPDLTKFQAKT